MILSHEDGHLRLIDFGTAKNLDDMSLNGPNFVGTPGTGNINTIDIEIVLILKIFGP